MTCVETVICSAPDLLRSRGILAFNKAVASVSGTPSLLHFPVGTHHLQHLLSLVGISAMEQWVVLVTCVRTVRCCRVNDVTNIQMCDLLWNFDAAYHVLLTEGMAILIYKEKQDIKRLGLYVLFPPGTLVSWFMTYVQATGRRAVQ